MTPAEIKALREKVIDTHVCLTGIDGAWGCVRWCPYGN